MSLHNANWSGPYPRMCPMMRLHKGEAAMLGGKAVELDTMRPRRKAARNTRWSYARRMRESFRIRRAA